MADPSASERAYQRLKADILSGALRQGPLDLRALSDSMRMSVTPVREALARLSAERFVRLAPHQGYAVPSLSSRRLENLYELAGGLVDMAIVRCSAGIQQGTASKTRPAYFTYADGISGLIQQIGNTQTNLELRDHLFALDERLQPARRCEPGILPDCEGELDALGALWDRRRFNTLRERFQSHFARRKGRADAIVRRLSEATGDD